MNINIRDVLTLSDNNRYVVVSKVYYENRDYLFLVDITNNSNLKFCYLDSEELVEISDKELNNKLLPLFYNKVKNMLPII